MGEYGPIINMDEVARLVRETLAPDVVPAAACGSGGGCATLYVGWQYRLGEHDECFPVLGGCGWQDRRGNLCYVEEFSIGYDQDHEADDPYATFHRPDPAATREQRAAAEAVRLYLAHPKAIYRDAEGDVRDCKNLDLLSADDLQALGYDPALRF